MSMLRPAFVFLALATPALLASDYDAMFSAMKKAWPQCETVAVDVKGPQDMGKAIGTLSGRKPDAIVLLAGDKVAGDGSSAASFLIQRMAGIKIPTAAITEAGVKQGAALGIGPGTGGKLLSNAKVAAVAGVAVPAGATPL